MDNRQLLGILGSILLFVGIFTPIVSLPIVGSMNYFRNGQGDGVFVLILAVISFILTVTRNFKGLWFTGLGSAAVLLFTFLNFQAKMAETRGELDRELAGNPFRGLADLAVESVQLQWGWAVLVVGAALVVAAAAIKPETPRRAA
jgi:hypothetical protein